MTLPKGNPIEFYPIDSIQTEFYPGLAEQTSDFAWVTYRSLKDNCITKSPSAWLITEADTVACYLQLLSYLVHIGIPKTIGSFKGGSADSSPSLRKNINSSAAFSISIESAIIVLSIHSLTVTTGPGTLEVTRATQLCDGNSHVRPGENSTATNYSPITNMQKLLLLKIMNSSQVHKVTKQDGRTGISAFI